MVGNVVEAGAAGMDDDEVGPEFGSGTADPKVENGQFFPVPVKTITAKDL